jgi:hypothetical protein
MLPAPSQLQIWMRTEDTYHARAWKHVPAESDSIALLNIIPAVFQGVKIHDASVKRLCASQRAMR